MQFSFNDILYTLVLFLLLFIAVYLFSSDKGKRISNILIAGFFLAVCLNLTDSFLLLKQVYLQYPGWAGWGSNLLLLCGPLIFFYTQSVLYKDFHLTKGKLLHFLPFLILFFVVEISYLVISRQAQIKILDSILKREIPPLVYVVSLAIYIHFLTYLFAGVRAVKKYEIAAANRYSESKKVTLGWLKTISWFFLLLILLSAINTYFSSMSGPRDYFFILGLIIFLLLLFVIIVLFKTLRNPGIFSIFDEREVDEANHASVHLPSPAQDHEKKRILDALQHHMESQQPFLEADLTLNDLALQIGVKPKLLSQVINELAHKNFFEFINYYRIEEARRRLTNPKDKKITVLEVMYQSGFNSKSSFNTLFKKQTGLTPGEFKRNSLT